MKKTTTIIVLEVLGNSLSLYIVDKITRDGISADKNGTSGAIPTLDMLIMLIALTLLIVAISIFWSTIRNTINHNKGNSAYKNLLYLTIWAMILSGPGMVIIPLMPFSLIAAFVLGIRALFLSYDKRNRNVDHVYVTACRILNAIILITISVGTTLSFMRV